MKRMVNKDGQQFRQYQQNEQSHLILTYLTQKGAHRWKSESLLGTGAKMWRC
jgi:hypothetical protein